MTLEKIKLQLAKLLPGLIHLESKGNEVFFAWSNEFDIKNPDKHRVTDREWLYVVHEVEKTLRKAPNTYQPGGIGHYTQQLEQKLGTEGKCLANFEQRSEALLKTLNLWEE